MKVLLLFFSLPLGFACFSAAALLLASISASSWPRSRLWLSSCTPPSPDYHFMPHKASSSSKTGKKGAGFFAAFFFVVHCHGSGSSKNNDGEIATRRGCFKDSTLTSITTPS
jgi:hypothetical protein